MDRYNPSAQVRLGKLVFLLSDAYFLLASSSLIPQLELSVQCHSSNPNTSVPCRSYVTGAKALLSAHSAFLPRALAAVVPEMVSTAVLQRQ